MSDGYSIGTLGPVLVAEAASVSSDITQCARGILNEWLSNLKEDLSIAEVTSFVMVVLGEVTAQYACSIAHSDGVPVHLRDRVVAANCANACGHVISRIPDASVRTEAVHFLRSILDKNEPEAPQ